MHYITYILAVVTTLLLVVPDVEARGGRGGGGGHGGGSNRGGGGGRSIQRSPSMSRSASRPPSRAQPTQNRQGQTQPLQSRVAPADRGRQNQTPRPLDRSPIDRGIDPREANRHRPIHSEGNKRVTTLPADRQGLANNIRNRVNDDRPNRGNWFNNWDHYNYHHPYYHNHNDWWKWATAAGVAGWLGWNIAPAYYDYNYVDGYYYWGIPGNDDVPFVYVDQSTAIDNAAGQQVSDEWMPLGVFALSSQSTSLATPNIYLQLALNKSGYISGTFYNSTTGQGYELEGFVDQQNQIASIKVSGIPNAPILETGIYNLTQAETPVRIHFGDGRLEDMLLTRIDHGNNQ